MIFNTFKLIINNKIEDSFNQLISMEKDYKNDSYYWFLRGFLCEKINEFNTAIFCYEKSILLDNLNITSARRLHRLSNKGRDFTIMQKATSALLESRNNYISTTLGIENSDSKIKKINTYYKIGYYLISESKVKTIFEIYNNEYTNENIDVFIPFTRNYISEIETLSELNIKKCDVGLIINDTIHYVSITRDLLDRIKNKERYRSVVFNYFNSSDSNIYALIKNMPNDFLDNYNINYTYGREMKTLDNAIKIPLLSSVSVSGHGIFVDTPYPELMHNIEVGHGAVSFKTCGKMSSDNVRYASEEHFRHINTYCASSNLDMILCSSFSGLSKNKFVITGCPRTDLLNTESDKNILKRLFNLDIIPEKVIFNMPTFNFHENSKKVEGDASLDDIIKIKNFDYIEFNKFLKSNNAICITKVHHGDERVLKRKNPFNDLTNILTLSNEDLNNHNLDLYEVLPLADILLTDYSSVYGDFLYMNKPAIFINSDIELYRQNRGIILEPYDSWTAGPKVQKQQALQDELVNIFNGNDHYSKQRNLLKPIYHQAHNECASENVWKLITSALEKNNL